MARPKTAADESGPICSTDSATSPTSLARTAAVLQRILALTAVIWHKDKIGAPIKRSLIPYDH